MFELIGLRFLAILVCLSMCTFASVLTDRPELFKDDEFDKNLQDLKSKLGDVNEKILGIQLLLAEDNVTESSAILREELFTLATGSRGGFAVPDAGVDRQRHVIASSISKLWQSLRFMEKVEEIINDVTVEVAKTISVDLDVNKMRKLMDSVFANIELKIGEDSDLYKEYVNVKGRADSQNLIGSSQGSKSEFEYVTTRPGVSEKGIMSKWYKIPLFRKFFVNKLFLQQYCKADGGEYSSLAKKIVRLAKANNEEFDDIQSIYDKILSSVAEKVSADKDYSYLTGGWIYELVEDTEDSDKITPILFQNLQERYKKYFYK